MKAKDVKPGTEYAYRRGEYGIATRVRVESVERMHIEKSYRRGTVVTDRKTAGSRPVWLARVTVLDAGSGDPRQNQRLEWNEPGAGIATPRWLMMTWSEWAALERKKEAAEHDRRRQERRIARLVTRLARWCEDNGVSACGLGRGSADMSFTRMPAALAAALAGRVSRVRVSMTEEEINAVLTELGA